MGGFFRTLVLLWTVLPVALMAIDLPDDLKGSKGGRCPREEDFSQLALAQVSGNLEYASMDELQVLSDSFLQVYNVLANRRCQNDGHRKILKAEITVLSPTYFVVELEQSCDGCENQAPLFTSYRRRQRRLNGDVRGATKSKAKDPKDEDDEKSKSKTGTACALCTPPSLTEFVDETDDVVQFYRRSGLLSATTAFLSVQQVQEGFTLPTDAPITPTTASPVTPITASPVTPDPGTEAPLPTPAPITPAPVTSAPTFPAPVTFAPTFPAPVTAAPISPAPVTPAPISPAPVTSAPLSPAPVTSAPISPAPVTAAPISPAPVTSAPISPAPVTSAPISPAPVTSAPISPAPVTLAPTTVAPVTPAPNTPAPITSAPITMPPITPAPVTAPPVTPAPVTSAPVIPITSSPITAAPATPAPVIIGTAAPLATAPVIPPATAAPATPQPSAEARATSAPTTDTPSLTPSEAPTELDLELIEQILVWPFQFEALVFGNNAGNLGETPSYSLMSIPGVSTGTEYPGTRDSDGAAFVMTVDQVLVTWPDIGVDPAFFTPDVASFVQSNNARVDVFLATFVGPTQTPVALIAAVVSYLDPTTLDVIVSVFNIDNPELDRFGFGITLVSTDETPAPSAAPVLGSTSRIGVRAGGTAGFSEQMGGGLRRSLQTITSTEECPGFADEVLVVETAACVDDAIAVNSTCVTEQTDLYDSQAAVIRFGQVSNVEETLAEYIEVYRRFARWYAGSLFSCILGLPSCVPENNEVVRRYVLEVQWTRVRVVRDFSQTDQRFRSLCDNVREDVALCYQCPSSAPSFEPSQTITPSSFAPSQTLMAPSFAPSQSLTPSSFEPSQTITPSSFAPSEPLIAPSFAPSQSLTPSQSSMPSGVSIRRELRSQTTAAATTATMSKSHHSATDMVQNAESEKWSTSAVESAQEGGSRQRSLSDNGVFDVKQMLQHLLID